MLLPVRPAVVSRLPSLRPLPVALALALGLLPAIAQAAEPVAEPDVAQAPAPLPEPAPESAPAATGSCPVVQPLANRKKEPATDPATTPIDASADWTESRSPQEILLHDNVRIRQGSRQLSANHAALNNDTGQMQASGDVVLTDQAIEMRGSEMQADMTRNSATVRDSEYRLTDRGMHGSASEFTVSEDGFITLKDATFTSCPEGDESWLLSADEMALDRNEGWGEASNLSINLFGIPAIYLPYMTFPIDERRRSGILLPAISYQEDSGLDLGVPYYWNIAENQDATFFPRWIEQHGFQLGTEYRYLTERSTGLLFAEGLWNDKEIEEGQPEDRWAAKVQHRTNFSEQWFASLNASGVSDDTYFEDFGRNVTASNATTLPRSAVLGYAGENWKSQLLAYEAQMIQTAVSSEPYKKLPEWRFTGLYPADPESGIFEFSLTGSATQFDHNYSEKVVGTRRDIAPKIALPMETAWGYLIPAAKFRHTQYEIDNPVTYLSRERERDLPIYSIDSGIFLERELTIDNRAFVHTLEPRVYALYVPYEQQDDIPIFDSSVPTPTYSLLFRDNRFMGADRQGDAEQVSVGLSSRLLSFEDGTEMASVSVGQAYFSADRRVTLKASEPDITTDRSPLYAEAALRVQEHMQLRGQLVWDEVLHNTQRGSIAFQYEPTDQAVVNIEHRYREYTSRTSEQVDLTFAWPINHEWELVGRWQHDLSESMDIDSFIGFGYESCCWAVRLVARHYLNARLDSEGNLIPGTGDEYDDGVYFQFVFKGLGGAGSSLRDLLGESIDGYEDRLTPR